MTDDQYDIDIGDKVIKEILTTGEYCEYHEEYEYDSITFVFTDGTELELTGNSAERIDIRWIT